MYTFRQGTVDYLVDMTENLVNIYNNMIDQNEVQPVDTTTMNKILSGCFVALHRLYPLAICGLDGQTYADIDEFADDSEMELQMQEIVAHNIILIVNNWRQTQFFQNDEYGKDIAETKYNPIDNTKEAPTDFTTRAATVAYNLFDINLKADRNLQQVQDVLKLMYNEFAQYLVTGTKI